MQKVQNNNEYSRQILDLVSGFQIKAQNIRRYEGNPYVSGDNIAEHLLRLARLCISIGPDLKKEFPDDPQIIENLLVVVGAACYSVWKYRNSIKKYWRYARRKLFRLRCWIRKCVSGIGWILFALFLTLAVYGAVNKYPFVWWIICLYLWLPGLRLAKNKEWKLTWLQALLPKTSLAIVGFWLAFFIRSFQQ
jgi:hypothetical protein